MSTSTQILRDILLSGVANTQAAIQQTLKHKGISISQPKISRLLHQLGAVKLVDAEGKTQYRLPHESGLIHELATPQEKIIVANWVLDIVANDMLIIIHTTPGAAAMLARIIDQHRLHLEVLGTIAGDDTIFIVPKQIIHIAKTQALIQALLKI